MHAKAVQISEFIENDLLKIVGETIDEFVLYLDGRPVQPVIPHARLSPLTLLMVPSVRLRRLAPITSVMGAFIAVRAASNILAVRAADHSLHHKQGTEGVLLVKTPRNKGVPQGSVTGCTGLCGM